MKARLLAVILLFACMAVAQLATPTELEPKNPASSAAQPGAPPAAANLGPLLTQLERAAQTATLNLARLRIDKWKTDGSYREQSQANSDSLQRNMTNALPAIIAQVRQNPESLGATFKLYRNVTALYDVLASLTESAGAFGPKDDFKALSSDANNLDGVRRSLADYLEQFANARDAEVARLRNQVRTAAASPSATAPKRIVVDNDEPAKKPARKKKPAPKPSTEAASPAAAPK